MVMRLFASWLAAVVPLLAVASPCCAADAPGVPVSVEIWPTTIEFRQHRHLHSIQVFGTTPDGYSVDLRDQARITSADPNIVTLDDKGLLRPVGNGETKVTVAVGKQTQSIAVKVRIPELEPPISFRHEVMPIMTRAGCNAGACHGYSLGKNGFKLSLRGQDHMADYPSLVREFAGRRVNFQFPAQSLLVAKPRGEATHEGGMRFARGSLSDDILVKWIGQGAPDDRKDPAQVTAVHLVPEKLVLRPGQKHRLQLIAEYNDGTRRDVTRLAVLTANSTQFADVNDDAVVIAGDAGETAVVARFERTFAAAGITVLNPGPAFTPAPVPTGHLIDRHVVEKLNRLKITPSPVADDEEFLRRVYLDLIGLQPKPDEVNAFLADKDPAKRAKTIDALFERPEYVDHWSLKWGDLLQNSRNSTGAAAVYQFREFIRGAVAANMPMDDFARRILTARGSIHDDPAAVYFASSKDANDTVERVTQVFCGVRMLCARCHTHPLENWTQADYYGLASFFSQVSLRADPRFPATANTKIVQLNRNAGNLTNPRTGRTQPPKFLGAEEPKLEPGQDRRQVYAAWLTSPKNPLFARGMVNRIWSYFFSRGIIDPVDDIRSTNPPINPALLDALTADFIAHKFDVRHLMRTIVTSATYQRTSVANESNGKDDQNFSHALPRRIPAEALLDSLVQATAVPESFGGVPGGFRAAQLPDGNVENPFLKLFGKPQRMDACECERDNGSNMLQALNFINGKSILNRVQNATARPALLVQRKISDEQLVTELYLWSLARHPKPKELQLGLDVLKSYGDKKTEAAQELMWALLNSKDFLLVH
jgi:hypothetical protein